MSDSSHVLLSMQELSRLLNLDDPAVFIEHVGQSPELMRWFVRPQIRDYVAERLHDVNLINRWRQPLKTENNPGHFVVPVVRKCAEKWRHAASAFLLPLKWAPAPHAMSIPRSLIPVAEQVRSYLRSSARLNEQMRSAEARAWMDAEWGLAWSFSEWNRVDFSALELSPESAWAPLTMGLASALLDQRLSEDLLSTGYWDSNRKCWAVGPETLAGKLTAGYEGGKRIFVVPSSVAQDARSH